MAETSGRRSALLERAAPWAIVALSAVAAFGVYLRFVDSGPLAADEWWHGAVSVSPGSFWYSISVLCAEAGTALGVAACGVVALALLLSRGMRRAAGSLATALLAGVMASELLKALVLRPRPWEQLYASHGSSYPSGHSMGAAALAVSLALIAGAALPRARARWVWAAAALWIALMMWSRTALHVHWLSDVVAGALIGAASALLSHRLWAAPHAKDGATA